MATQTGRRKSSHGSTPRRLLRGLRWMLSGLLGMAVVVWVVLPLIIQYAVPRELARQGLSVTVRRAAVDPFTHTVSLYDARLVTRAGVAVSWAAIDARLDLRRWFNGQLRVTALRLHDARIELGVKPANPPPATAAATSGAAPDIDRLDLEDVHLPSWPGVLDQSALLRHARIASVTTLLRGEATRFAAELVLGETPLRLDGTLRLSAATTTLEARLAATDVDLSAFAGALRNAGIQGLAGRIDAEGDLRVAYRADTHLAQASFDGNTRLTGLRARIAGAALTQAELQWRGRIEAKTKTAAPPTLSARGGLDAPRIMLAVDGEQPLAIGFRNVRWQGRLNLGTDLKSDAVVSADQLTLAPSGVNGRSWNARAEDLNGHVTTDGGARLRDLSAAKILAEWPQGKSITKLTVEAVVASAMTLSLAHGMRIARIESASLSGATRQTKGPSADWRVLGVNAEKLVWGDAPTLAALSTRAATLHLGADTLELAAASAHQIRIAGDGLLHAARSGLETLHLSRGHGDQAAEGFVAGLKLNGLAIGSSGGYSSHGLNAKSVRWQQPGRGDLDLADVRLTDINGKQLLAIESATLSVGHGAWQGAEGLTAEVQDAVASGVLLNAAGEVKGAEVTVVDADLRTADGARWRVEKLAGKSLLSNRRGKFSAAQLDAEVLRSAPPVGVGGWRAEAARLSGLTRGGDGAVAVKALAAGGFTLAANADRPQLRGDGIALSRLVVAADGAARAEDVSLASIAADSESGQWRGKQLSAHKLNRAANGEFGVALLGAASVDLEKGVAQRVVADGLEVHESRVDATGALTIKEFAAQTLHGNSGPSTWRSGMVRGELLSGARSAGYRLDRITVDGAKIEDPERSAWFDVKSLEFSKLAYDAAGLHAESLRVAAIDSAPADPDSAALAVGRADLTALTLAPDDELAVARVALDGFDLTLGTEPNGGWMVPRLPRLASGADAGAGVRIGEIAARDGGRVRLVDRRPQQPFRLTLGIEEARVQGFDTGTLGSDARFTLRASRDRFWSNALEGRLTRTVDGFDVHAKGHIQGADLKALSPYAETHLALHVLAGHADVDFDMAIERGTLSGSSEIVLSGLQTEAAPGAPESAAATAGASLQGTLALLADKHRTMRLKVPFSGQADDPKFNFGDVYAQALTKTARTALLIYLQPVGLVLSAKSLFDKVAGLRFRSVLFVAGAPQPGAEALSYLDELAKRLLDRPALELRLCAKAVPRDGEAYAREARAAVAAGETVAARTMTGLAAARGRAVRAYLETKHLVPARQLRDCPAVVEDDPDAAPRVEMLLAGTSPASAPPVAAPQPAKSK